MTVEVDDRAVAERSKADPKAVVRRLIEEVINAGRLDLIEEVYAPQMAAGARRWIAPFLASFPDVQMEIVELIAEGGKVVGRFRCSATNLGPGAARRPPDGASSGSTRSTSTVSTTAGSPRPGGSRTIACASGSSGSHPAERTSKPSSTATTSTPASASRPKKLSMSEPLWSGSA